MVKRQVVTRAVLVGAAWLAVWAAVAYMLAQSVSPWLGGAVALLAVAVLAVATWACFTPNAPLFGKVVTGRGASRRVVARSFDGGPAADITPRILDDLSAAGARATFFVLGRHAEQHPEIVRRAADGGHEVASHGYDHGLLTFAREGEVLAQLDRTERALDERAGTPPPRLFRAPHGFRNPFVARAARRRDYQVVGWSTGVWDTAKPGVDKIVRRSLRGLRPGAILLLHDADGSGNGDDRSQTAAAVPQIVEAVREQGYEFVTVSELAEIAPPRKLSLLRLFVAVVALAVLLGLAAARVHPSRLNRVDIAWAWVMVSLAANLISIALKAVVWKAALDAVPEGRRARYLDVVPALFIGFLINTLLFARVGEVARVSVLHRRLRMHGRELPATTIAGTVLSEQLALGLGLAILFVATPLLVSVPHTLLRLLLGFLAAIVVLAAAFVGLEIYSRARRLRRHGDEPDLAVTRWRALLLQAETWMHGITRGQQIIRKPRLAVLAVTAGVLSWLAQVFGIYAALKGFSIDATAGMATMVFLVSTLVQLFPILPGNLGVFQAGVTLPLTAYYNVDVTHAFAFSIGLQLIEAALGVGLGFVFLSREGLSLAEARALRDE